jgi:hypothetical protein
MALRIMDQADAWDDALVLGACDWLASAAPAEGGAAFVEPGSADWPHAPWWVPEDGHPASLVTTGMIAGTLYRRGPLILDRNLVALDPEAPGETHGPLDFAPEPGSLARSLFPPGVIDAHLDHLAAAQRGDGGWMFNWLAWSPAAERDWRGFLTVDALRVLRANGRL